MVCLGNICRSPIAEAVFNHLVRQRSISEKWFCESAATGSWHVGGQMDSRAASTLQKHNIASKHTVRQIRKDDFRKFDFIFGMDKSIISDLKRMAPADTKASIELLGSYDPNGKHIIRDPYYDDNSRGFEECYEISYRACSAFLDKHSQK